MNTLRPDGSRQMELVTRHVRRRLSAYLSRGSCGEPASMVSGAKFLLHAGTDDDLVIVPTFGVVVMTTMGAREVNQDVSAVNRKAAKVPVVSLCHAARVAPPIP